MDRFSLGGMVATLVTFGDSWPAGAELLPEEKTFGQILAEKLNRSFCNYSKNATSLEHMVLQLDSFVRTNPVDTMCVFFLTSSSRSIAYKKDRWLEVSGSKEYENLYSEQLSKFRANMVMICLQSICRKYNLQDFYIAGWEKFPIVLSGIDSSKIYDSGNTHCLNFFKVNDTDPTDDPNYIFYYHNHFIRPKVCHPNQLGHQTIAEKLYEWIVNQ